jgi:hypothetical protein
MIALDIAAIIASLLKGTTMKMERLIIQVPAAIKAKLNAERKRGTSAAGLIRYLLEQHFNPIPSAQKGR